MIRFALALSLFWLLSSFGTLLKAQHQYSQHRIALEVLPNDSLNVQNQSNQLLYWAQSDACTYQLQPLRSLSLHHLRDGRFKGYAQPQDSLALRLDSVRMRLRVSRYITVYDPQTLAPRDSVLLVSAQPTDIQGFATQLHWFFDSTAKAARTQLKAFAPILSPNPLTWIKLSDERTDTTDSTPTQWRRQTRLDIELAMLPEQGAGLQAIIQQLLQALRQKELRAYNGPYSCDTAAAEQLDIWLQGGPLLYTLKHPDTQEEFIDTIQILPLEAHRVRRIACLLLWKYDQNKQQLRVELKALGPIKRKPAAGKAKEQPLFWWHFK